MTGTVSQTAMTIITKNNAAFLYWWKWKTSFVHEKPPEDFMGVNDPQPQQSEPEPAAECPERSENSPNSDSVDLESHL